MKNPSTAQDSPDYSTVARVVRERKTLKVLGSPDEPMELDSESARMHDEQVERALREAGWAPFHFNRGVDGLHEPWRASVLPQEVCRRIAKDLESWCGEGVAVGKLPAMFAACGSAVLVTWLPQFRGGLADPASTVTEPEKQRLIDDEHLAAAAAMTQTFLLLLTASGFGTYWSSGGTPFRTRDVLTRLGVGADERLIALVFVEYPETREADMQRVPGKHRDARSHAWIRRVTSVD